MSVHPALIAAFIARRPTPLQVLGARLLAWHDNQDLATIFSDFAGTAGAVGSRAAVHLDKAKLTGLSPADYLAGVSDIRSSGLVGLSGSATAASYNTSTGAGSVTRGTSISNQSYVYWTGLVKTETFYVIDIENTGANSLTIRAGPYNGAGVASVAAGARKTVYLPAGIDGSTQIAITSGNNSTTATFTVHSFKPLPGCARYQITTAQQPYLRKNATTGAYYLEADGSDDGMVSPSLNLSAKNHISVCTAARRLSDAASGQLIEQTTDATANNGFHILARTDSGPVATWQAACGNSASGVKTSTAYPSPVTSVLIAEFDKSQSSSALENLLYVNGALAATTVTAANNATGNFATAPVYYFRRAGASDPFNGHEYGSMIVDGGLSAAEIAYISDYYNRLTVAY